MKVLAIDYGTVHTGLAISDSCGRIAGSLKTIHTKSSRTLIREISEVCIEHNVSLILVGLPLGLAGKPTQISKKVQTFIKDLQLALAQTNKENIEIQTINETNSSIMANQNKLASLGDIHSEAARILLQEFLDNQ